MTDWIDTVSEENIEAVRKLWGKAQSPEEQSRVLREWHPRGDVNVEPIGSLEEYFRHVRLAANHPAWFRGQSRDFGVLAPKLYRADLKIKAPLDYERRFFLELRRRGRALAPSIDANDTWSWYFLMQHYGAPTRLLDWTNDAAVALFFALDTARDDSENPVVFVLSPAVLTGQASLGAGETALTDGVFYTHDADAQKWLGNLQDAVPPKGPSVPNSAIPLLPSHLDPRIGGQVSRFTLFGLRPNAFTVEDGPHASILRGKYGDMICRACGQRALYRMVIDGAKKGALRRELARIGVTTSRVYPGLAGLCAELADELA